MPPNKHRPLAPVEPASAIEVPVGQGGEAKILLPSPNRGWPQSISITKRTSHACGRCRLLKIKCSGGLRCTKCVLDDQACVYADGKRERAKKNIAESARIIEILQEENHVLLDAIRSFCADPHYNVNGNPELVALLSKYPQDHHLPERSHVAMHDASDTGSPMTDGPDDGRPQSSAPTEASKVDGEMTDDKELADNPDGQSSFVDRQELVGSASG